MALRGLETAQSRLERAEALAAYLQKQLLELEDSSSEKADKAETKLQDAETKLQDAETKLEKAKKELKEAEQKYAAKASVQAGRVQAGASAFAVVAVAFGLQHSRVCFRSTVFAFWGHALLSARIPPSSSFTVLACSPSGSGRGSWLLQVQANLVALRVLPMLQNGVSILGSRWGGVSLFSARFDRVLVLAVRLCVALRLQLFLRMRLRLLYLCLCAWPPCCRSVVGVVAFLDLSGSGRAREVRQRFAGQQVTGHQVESFMSACVDARLLH